MCMPGTGVPSKGQLAKEIHTHKLFQVDPNLFRKTNKKTGKHLFFLKRTRVEKNAEAASRVIPFKPPR